MRTFKQFLKESSSSLSQWKNKEPAKYAEHLQKTFGQPDELTSNRAIWYDVDGFKTIHQNGTIQSENSASIDRNEDHRKQ
jgi:hypothetical protein